MFEELIAQGKDMIGRLEPHVDLTHVERKALPVVQQVTYKEAVVWQTAVEERIRTTFGADTLARYESIIELRNTELERDEGDEVTRTLNLWRRIVALLSELQERLEKKLNSDTHNEQAQKLKGLERENAQLKKLVADLSMNKSILEETLAKKP